MIAKATRFLLLQGPVTGQERWEEQSGYSPSTLAMVIAALVCASEFARARSQNEVAEITLTYADWLASHLEDWMVTSRGELVPGCRGTTFGSPLAIRPPLIRTPMWIRWRFSLPMARGDMLRATSSVATFFISFVSEFETQMIR